LVHVAPEDRAFVAAEMSAFLFAWLSQLECRVLNRPRGISLCGPNWQPLQWTLAAARAGLAVAPVRRNVPDRSRAARGEQRAHVEALVVGERCIGAIGADQQAGALRLAAAAGTGLLALWFAPRTKRFVAASAMPSLAGADMAETVRAYLVGGAV